MEFSQNTSSNNWHNIFKGKFMLVSFNQYKISERLEVSKIKIFPGVVPQDIVLGFTVPPDPLLFASLPSLTQRKTSGSSYTKSTCCKIVR